MNKLKVNYSSVKDQPEKLTLTYRQRIHNPGAGEGTHKIDTFTSVLNKDFWLLTPGLPLQTIQVDFLQLDSLTVVHKTNSLIAI